MIEAIGIGFGIGDAAHAAALLAVDPVGLGGVLLQTAAGPSREAWTRQLKDLLGPSRQVKRMPLQIADERLLGGLDFAATLHAGRPVAQRGLLADCDGGVLVVPMAERLTVGTAARLTLALDRQEVAIEREGLTLRYPARFGVVAFDESAGDDEAVSVPLTDRLALHVRLAEVRPAAQVPAAWTAQEVESARTRLPGVTAGDDVLQALCAAAQTLGVSSMRAPLLALRAASAAAALNGRDMVDEDDARLAARLVLGPRATMLPPGDEAEPGAEPPAPPDAADDVEDTSSVASDQPLEDRVLDAATAAIPPGLLVGLAAGHATRLRSGSSGRAGALRLSARRG